MFQDFAWDTGQTIYCNGAAAQQKEGGNGISFRSKVPRLGCENYAPHKRKSITGVIRRKLGIEGETKEGSSEESG